MSHTESDQRHFENAGTPTPPVATPVDVDVFDALTTAGPYKAAVSADRAYGELIREARRGWHRHDLVDVFIGPGARAPS